MMPSGDGVAVPKEDEGRHGQRLVDGAHERGKGGTRVMARWQLGGKEEIGLDLCGMDVHRRRQKARPAAAELGVGELEEENERLQCVQRLAFAVGDLLPGSSCSQNCSGVAIGRRRSEE